MVATIQGSHGSSYLEFSEYENHRISNSGNHSSIFLHFEDMKTDPESEGTGLKITYLVSGRSGADRPDYLTLS